MTSRIYVYRSIHYAAVTVVDVDKSLGWAGFMSVARLRESFIGGLRSSCFHQRALQRRRQNQILQNVHMTMSSANAHSSVGLKNYEYNFEACVYVQIKVTKGLV